MPEPKPPQGPATSPREAKNKTDKLDVAITVHPPEFFEKNEGEVLEIATTDNFEIVYKKEKNGLLRYYIYNETGKLVKSDEVFPMFAFGYRQLVDSFSYNGNLYLRGSFASYVMLETLLKNFGFSNERVEILLRYFRELAPGKEVMPVSAFQNIGVWHVTPGKVRTDSERKKFIFQVDKTIYIYTTEVNGVVVSPDRWNLEKIDDNSNLTPAFLAKNPFLREFIATQKGRPLPNLDIAINHENGIMSVIDLKQNIRLFTDSAAGYVIDPNDKKTVYYINAQQRELKSFVADKASPSQTEVTSISLPFSGTVKEFKLDPQGNFFICTVEEDGMTKILILEKDTLEISGQIDNVFGKLDTDNLGNLYFVDKDGKLRFATTNFMTFQKGGLEEARKKKQATLLKLKDKLAGLDLSTLGKGSVQKELSTDASEEQIIRSLAKQIDKQFDPEVDKADTIDKLDTIGNQIDALKGDPELAEHPQIFAGIEKKVQEKMSTLKTEELRLALDSFEKLLEDTKTAAQAVNLESLYNMLVNDRQKVVISDPKIRKQVDERIKKLETSKDKKFAEFEGELLALISDSFAQIQELAKEVSTPEELNALAAEKAVLDFERGLTQIKDRKLAKEWREKYKAVLNTQKSALEGKIEAQKDAERSRLAQILEDSREIFEEIETSIKEIADPKELTKWIKGNPLVTKFNTKILALPEDMRANELDNLNDLIKERKRDLEHREVLQMPKKGGEVNFGKESFPVFEDVKVVWQSKVVPLNEGAEYGNLVFEDNMGRVFRPDLGSVPVSVDDPLTKEAIALFKTPAEKHFESLKRRVPGYSDKWVLNDFNKDILGDIAKLSKIQMADGSGILILEGEAGTGKNIMIDMFAHFTNRETFTFSCNFQSEKEDITYAFKFDPNRGTYQVDSRLIQMLQTPGSVIILDEINTLPPGVSKMLNPLLDYRRTLFLPDGREIKAHPSVLIVGAMNPQNYLGVKPLSQEVKSRSRILSIVYPPEKVGNKFAPYEAEILAKYVESLRGVTQEEFQKMWDYVVNNDLSNGADKLLNTERKDSIKKLQHIIKTANKIREAYRAFRTGKSNDIIEFVFSLRESVAITSELNHTKDVTQAIKDVVLPKIGDPSEKAKIQTIIENV